jgi:hypothetical protein
MRRTKQGLILEKILSSCKDRYLLCWNGEDDPYDCACCLTWPADQSPSCGCICHTRIEEMVSHPHIKLWLVAAEAMEHLPFYPSSYEEKLAHSRTIAALHKSTAYITDCTCSDCEDVREADAKEAAKKLGDMYSSHITSDASPKSTYTSDM